MSQCETSIEANGVLHSRADRESAAPTLSVPLVEKSESLNWVSRHGAAISILTLLVLMALIRLRLADIPLERDEGEYAYAGKLILEGVPPYQLAYNMKFPGIYYAYSFILALFGSTPWDIRVGLLLINGATTTVVFFLAKRVLQSSLAASISAIAFAILSIDQWILGIFAHATHFVVLPAMAGLLVVLRSAESPRLIGFVGGGILLGISVLMKQNGAFFLALGIMIAFFDWVRRNPRRSREAILRSGAVAIGGALPLVVVGMILFQQGVFQKFWFWTVDYAREYVSEVSWVSGWGMFRAGVYKVTQANGLIWALSAMGLPILWLTRWSTDARIRTTTLVVTSLVSICPGFYFRPHYFILILPAAALLAGIAVESIRRGLSKLLPAGIAIAVSVALFAIAVGSYVHREWSYLFQSSTFEISRTRYGINPFVESLEVARYIASRSGIDDRIAILGSEPQIYYYANRRSATGYIYIYPLMENHQFSDRMQGEMIDEIEQAHPKFVVFVAVPTSWQSSNANERIITWADRYLRSCYEQVGIVDLHRPDGTQYVWDSDVQGFTPRSSYAVLTFARKSEVPCSAGN